GAVVALAPSNVGWGGCCSADITVGYTLGGADLPGAEVYQHPDATHETVVHGKAPASMRERFLAGMLSGEPAIRVEAIQAPIMLMAGDADPLWPAALAVELLLQRLRANEFQQPIHAQIYQGAGHSIGSAFPFWAMRSVGTATPHPVDGVLMPKGGTPSANAYAARDGANKILEFYRTYLSVVSHYSPSSKSIRPLPDEP
ncbi:MAG: acyl-CoA thioester hydrolase/BAAT C-terminal domain-containing protein, partial [Wenzhouxiangella sp.]|nr:acyl-CoA thioester hydrolase/BAAT C-terminal domain-containing protein [Wenzhouxiangella sp.]